MSNDYDFILDNMVYSFSSADSFDTCNYNFFLTYIKSEDRQQNFFSDYGLFIHDILEKWFTDELDLFELPSYYEDHYQEKIIMPPPPYPPNMAETYYSDGLEFLENINFDKNKYEVILTEDKINYRYNEINLVVKPDIILKDKQTGEFILLDYKTSKLGKVKSQNEKKLKGYKKQFYLYSYFIWLAKEIKISKILVWFVRNNQLIEIPIDRFEILEAIEWFESTINKIKKENEWKPNLDKSNDYFCKFLCGARDFCQPKLEQIAKERPQDQLEIE